MLNLAESLWYTVSIPLSLLRLNLMLIVKTWIVWVCAEYITPPECVKLSNALQDFLYISFLVNAIVLKHLRV